jgi:deoxyadenosine/deoxycytidine kinase
MSSIMESAYQICLEGNIGAGKSTLLNYFNQVGGVDVLPETIDLWRTLPMPGTSSTHNLLESFYQDPGKHTFAFQSYVMVTKVDQQLAASASPVKLLERGLHSVFHIFSEALKAEGHFAPIDYAVHRQWYEHFTRTHKEMMPNIFLWLKTDPEVNFERIKARGRAEEASITLEYLTRLGDLHERWLTSSPFAERTVIIDGNRPKNEVLESCKAILAQVLPAEIKAQLEAFKEN